MGRITNTPRDVSFLFDTGSRQSIISDSLAHELGLTYTADNSQTAIRGLSAQLVNVLGVIPTSLALVTAPSKTFRVNLSVVAAPLEFVILGNDFLSMQNDNIDYTKYCLTLDGTTFFFSEPSPTDMSDPDKTFVQRGVCLFAQRNEMINIVRKYFTPRQQGTIQGIEHEINLTSDKPFYSKPYRIPLVLCDPVKEELNKMIEAGFIQRSHSAYASPAFAILKRNGDIRFIVDSCRLTALPCLILIHCPLCKINCILFEGPSAFLP